MSEFKPCPFCGGEMRIVPLLGNCACYGVECETGPCPGSHINQTWPTAEEAVAALNRRAQTDNDPLTCDGCTHHNSDVPWPEICFECKRQSRQDMYHSKPEPEGKIEK